MSDYISKSALIEELQKRIGGDLDIEDVEYLEKVVNSIPTVDEKEIIRKPMGRILERIEKARQKYQRLVKEQGEKEDESMNIHFRGVMKIVKEEGEIE